MQKWRGPRAVRYYGQTIGCAQSGGVVSSDRKLQASVGLDLTVR